MANYLQWNYPRDGDGSNPYQTTSFGTGFSGTGFSLEKTTLETKQLGPAKTTAFDTPEMAAAVTWAKVVRKPTDT